MAVYFYIRRIVMNNATITIVEHAEYRRFSRFNVPLARKTVVFVIFKLVHLVEQRVSSEMKNTSGALLFDGWSCAGTHFIAAIASYCTHNPVKIKGSAENDTIPRLSLIALSPMGKIEPDESNEVDDEATTFNAETHLAFFRAVFQFYAQSFDSWCVCLVSDNTSTNMRVARLCGKPIIVCMSHLLNLEVNSMFSSSPGMERTVDAVHNTMKAAKQIKMLQCFETSQTTRLCF